MTDSMGRPRNVCVSCVGLHNERIIRGRASPVGGQLFVCQVTVREGLNCDDSVVANRTANEDTIFQLIGGSGHALHHAEIC